MEFWSAGSIRIFAGAGPGTSMTFIALLHGLRLVVTLGIKRLLVYGDSSAIINQVNKDWDCTKETTEAYCPKVRKLEKHFQGLEFHHVVWDLNVVVDVLAKLGFDRATVLSGIFVQELAHSSIKEETDHSSDTPMPYIEVLIINPAWTQVYIDYIKEHELHPTKLK